MYFWGSCPVGVPCDPSHRKSRIPNVLTPPTEIAVYTVYTLIIFSGPGVLIHAKKHIRLLMFSPAAQSDTLKNRQAKLL